VTLTRLTLMGEVSGDEGGEGVGVGLARRLLRSGRCCGLDRKLQHSRRLTGGSWCSRETVWLRLSFKRPVAPSPGSNLLLRRTQRAQRRRRRGREPFLRRTSVGKQHQQRLAVLIVVLPATLQVAQLH